jgi:5-methylcytosine-specific restriction protein B
MQLARYLTQDAPLTRELVQFHPSYGYEDFVEGLRPTVKDGIVTFEPRAGTLLRLVQRMESNDLQHVLVIDEINRANLTRVFGELMYLVEYRDRAESVQLLYTEGFTLPRNLILIGTMNTADRSIRTLDVAMRRRFDVFECAPDVEILARYYARHTCRVADLDTGFVDLNAWLTTRLDRHHTVGHTFLMHPDFTAKRLRSVWERQLLPLFDDYFFDQPDLLAELRVEKFWPSVADGD